MDRPPNDWDKLQIARSASFLQSSWWGAFQAQVSSKSYFLSQNGWSCLLLEKKNRLGTYLFSQYGPTVGSKLGLDGALEYLIGFGRQRGADWLSLEPMSPKLSPEDIKTVLRRHNARPAARHREPDFTSIIDLSPPAEVLLARISQSTRSFIRKNSREKFISFRTSRNPNEIQIFIQMLNLVAGRNNVNFFPESYFQKQARLLMPAGVMRLELALAGNQPVAAAVFHDYGQTSTYTYAASLPKARQTNASALLLWQSILNAKARGITKLDLYGIAPTDAPRSHPWAGFTSFKQKFGGQSVQLAGTWDIALSPRYRLYRSAHQIRKVIRRH